MCNVEGQYMSQNDVLKPESFDNNDFYKSIIENSPVGYAFHKVILDTDNIPCDYEFIEVNAAFEKFTGLKRENIVGKNVTEVIPSIKLGEFDWIKFYGDISINGNSVELDQYSEGLKSWYKIKVYSPQKHYFITHFIDITTEKENNDEYRGFFEVNLDLLCIADKNGKFLKTNKEWETVWAILKTNCIK